MLYKELEEFIKKGIIKVGDEVWITDFRHDNILEKPIRNIEPTRVQIFDNSSLPVNKRIYYASYHFRPLGKNNAPLSKILAPYDNTGYRVYTGISVNIFATEQEARNCYREQCEKVKQQIFEAQEEWEKRFATMMADVENKLITN